MFDSVLLTNLLAVVGMMTLVWLISIPLKDVSIIDLFWGMGFVLISWLSYFLQHEAVPGLILPVIVSLWGIRLAGYLYFRNHGKPEDQRYAKMRENQGSSFWWKSYFIVFLLQAAIMWVVSFPLQLAGDVLKAPALLVLGLGFWLTGLLFESIGDWQLMQFKSESESSNQVLDQGLWKYTRHPNYFGDFLVWWGFWLVSLSLGSPPWTIIGPAIMSFFLMKVSGVAMTEEILKKSKPAYQDYIARTNAFFPGFPKS